MLIIQSNLHECEADMLVQGFPRKAEVGGAHVSVAAAALPSSSAAHSPIGPAIGAGTLFATTFFPTADSTPYKVWL